VLFFIDQENERNERQKAVDKIMNYPLFNNKNRVKKLLSTTWPVKKEKEPEPKR